MARRRRGLSADEKALWSRIAATTQPLHPHRVVAPAPPSLDSTRAGPAEPPPAARSERPDLSTFGIGTRPGDRKLPGQGIRVDLSPPLREALDSQPLRMDHKTHRHMTRGKLQPEARLDLHGMTLAVAQPVLTRFILQAQASGRRLVLVITGKGRAGGPDAPLPVRPGALRHAVPHWLHMPPLSAAVLQVTPAHRRHGGDGAYYVYLRRQT